MLILFIFFSNSSEFLLFSTLSAATIVGGGFVLGLKHATDADHLAAIHARAGVPYVAAPVFGRPDVAAMGKLNIVAAGDPRLHEAALKRLNP